MQEAPLTHGRVWRIAAPIILSNATVPLLGVVDTAVIGRMGDAAALGAVGLGAVILATIYWIFGFLRMGTSGLAAQAHGAGDEAERGAILLRALTIAALAGLAMVLAQGALIAGAFTLSPASAPVEAMARPYLAIRIWGAPATIGLYALTGWLIATERARAVLGLQLWINGVNIALDLWFVPGLGWGVPGVAAATLIAEWSGLALGLYLCRAAFAPLVSGASGKIRARVMDRAALRRMLAVNGDIMIRSVILQLSFTLFIFLAAREGDLSLAANQVLLQFMALGAHLLDGVAFAAETLVGQAVGRRRPAEVARAMRLTLIWGMAGGLALALVFAVIGPWAVDQMTTAPQVRATAREFLPWVALAPLIGAAAWSYDGIYIGATLTRLMRDLMLLSVLAYGVALAVFLPLFGNHGLWAGLTVLNLCRSLTMWHWSGRVIARAAP